MTSLHLQSSQKELEALITEYEGEVSQLISFLEKGENLHEFEVTRDITDLENAIALKALVVNTKMERFNKSKNLLEKKLKEYENAIEEAQERDAENDEKERKKKMAEEEVKKKEALVKKKKKIEDEWERWGRYYKESSTGYWKYVLFNDEEKLFRIGTSRLIVQRTEDWDYVFYGILDIAIGTEVVPDNVNISKDKRSMNDTEKRIIEDLEGDGW